MIGGNEPCPCCSGKKFKNCCMNPKNITTAMLTLSKNRVFSYNNFRLLYSFSPVFTLSDYEKWKTCDGKPATPRRNSPFPIPQYFISSPFGYNVFPVLVTRSNKGLDYTMGDIFSSKTLLTYFTTMRNFDLSGWPMDFSTVAFMPGDNLPGFALVYHYGNKPFISFSLRSELYPVTREESDKFLAHLKDSYNYLPSGATTGELNRMVYTFSYNVLEQYILWYHDIDLTLPENVANDIDNDYLTHAMGQYTQYEKSEDSEKFFSLGRIYRDHCVELMEAVCKEKSMKVHLENRSLVKHVDEIESELNRLSSLSNKNKNISEAVKAAFEKEYAPLDQKALQSLIYAETMYQINCVDNVFGWGAIVREYALSVEVQLRHIFLKRHYDLFRRKPMLNDYIQYIEVQRISPYCNHVSQLREIASIRNQCSHETSGSKADVEQIRYYLIDNCLAKLLC